MNEEKYMFHHCMPLALVSYDEIVPSEDISRNSCKRNSGDATMDKLDEDMWVCPNLWLEKQVGFYPLFMAYGHSDMNIGITGYDNNWRSCVSSCYRNGKYVGVRRKKGEFPNYVLFSYASVPDAVFMDYLDWFLVLNSYNIGYDIRQRYVKMIFKRSWSVADWRRRVKKHPGTVMAVVPKLDLRTADAVSARNAATVKELTSMGFSNVRTARIPVVK